MMMEGGARTSSRRRKLRNRRLETLREQLQKPDVGGASGCGGSAAAVPVPLVPRPTAAATTVGPPAAADAVDTAVYEPAIEHFKIPHGLWLREATSVAVDSHDRVYVFNRGNMPVMVFDVDGNLIDRW
jgi:hypothetical protein